MIDDYYIPVMPVMLGILVCFPVVVDGDSVISESFGHLIFGYRFQSLNDGFTFRAFACPVFNSIDFIPYYGGISAGYKF